MSPDAICRAIVREARPRPRGVRVEYEGPVARLKYSTFCICTRMTRGGDTVRLARRRVYTLTLTAKPPIVSLYECYHEPHGFGGGPYWRADLHQPDSLQECLARIAAWMDRLPPKYRCRREAEAAGEPTASEKKPLEYNYSHESRITRRLAHPHAATTEDMANVWRVVPRGSGPPRHRPGAPDLPVLRSGRPVGGGRSDLPQYPGPALQKVLAVPPV